jgi:hypothetical protein
MSPPDGSLALKKVLKFQNDKMDDSEALTAMMQLMIRNRLSEVRATLRRRTNVALHED